MDANKKEVLRQLYKDGLIGHKPILYIDIHEKYNSLPGLKADRVKIIAKGLGCSTDTIYRALRTIDTIQ